MSAKPRWETVEEWARAQQELNDRLNRRPLDPTKTALIRGRQDMLTKLLVTFAGDDKEQIEEGQMSIDDYLAQHVDRDDTGMNL